MKYLKILAAAAVALCLQACQKTWLMYDTAQQDHLYFQESVQTHTTSFALIPEDEIIVSTTVYLMGQPSSSDRSYTVEFIPVADGTHIQIGDIVYNVASAREGEDYTLGPLVLPAGATSTSLDVHLHRTPRMLEGDYLRVGLRLKDDGNFLACAPDSARKAEIMTPEFYVYVNDGEPACPSWWRASNGPIGWHWDFGKFYPAKYRRFLEYFHETKETNPTFYNYCVDAYGYYLDEPNPELLASSPNLMNTFWRKVYSSAWAKYVFIPLFNYYKAYYAEHPDDPNAEPMGDGTIDQGQMAGWSDPMDPRFGFFN